MDIDDELGAGQSELWSEGMQLQEARERATWHEKMSRRNVEQSDMLQAIL